MLPVCAETVALPVAWAGKPLQAPETCQREQQGLVAVAFVPVGGGDGDGVACLDHADHADAVACGLTPISEPVWAAPAPCLRMRAGSSKINSAVARGGGPARAGRVLALPGSAKAMPSGPQKN